MFHEQLYIKKIKQKKKVDVVSLNFFYLLEGSCVPSLLIPTAWAENPRSILAYQTVFCTKSYFIFGCVNELTCSVFWNEAPVWVLPLIVVESVAEWAGMHRIRNVYRDQRKWGNSVVLLMAEPWQRICFIYPICIKVGVAITMAGRC